jgi:hypothetical protein
MSNMKTGYNARNAKDGGTRRVLRLKEIYHLSTTFTKCVLLGDALRALSSTGTFGAHLSFFLIRQDRIFLRNVLL